MVVSRKLVAIPRRANIHIQKTAPGPPMAIAITGPVMFPTPIRLAMLMQNTWNEETFSFSPTTLRENVTRHISLICVN